MKKEELSKKLTSATLAIGALTNALDLEEGLINSLKPIVDDGMSDIALRICQVARAKSVGELINYCNLLNELIKEKDEDETKKD